MSGVKLLREELGVAMEYRERSLRYQWEVTFGVSRDFRRIGDLLAQLELLSLESLSLAAANELTSGLEQVTSVFKRMDRFDAEDEASPESREQLANEIHQAADALSAAASPCIRSQSFGG